MRLLFCLFKYFPYGGLQRDFKQIAEICQNRGHSVHVYTMTWQGDVPEGFQVTEFHPRGLTNHKQCLNFTKQVSERLVRERFDLVIGFNKMPYLDIYYAADPCYQAKVKAHKSFISRFSRRYRTYVALEKAVFNPKAENHILLISEKEKKQFKRYYHTQEKRFHRLQPGISRDRLPGKNAGTIRAQVRTELQIREDSYMLLMIGSGFQTKGLDRSLLALASLPDILKRKSKLVVIGQGKSKPFLHMAKRLAIRRQVVFLGGREDIPRFLLGADLLLHPAYSENTGTVLLEAMASGVPVLATYICGYASYVSEAGAGLLIPSPFQQNIMNNLLEHMLSSGHRPEWQHNGHEYIKRMDMFGLPERAVALIESIAGDKDDVS